jgi:dephospho-CoA kinase
MILLGLTGGIGSGKSTVSALLAARGAIIIDADAIARELQAPGTPLVIALKDRFGDSIVDENVALIRPALATIVFADPEALKDLNKIVHPAIAKEMDLRLQEQRDTNNVVVLDIPLLAENPRKGLSGVVVVDIPTELAVERLVEFRSMTNEDAAARIAQQASREDRVAIADKVIDNSGDMESLSDQVEDVWQWALTLPPAAPDAGERSPST